MPTHRANVTFRVKEPGADPVISVEQLGGDVEIVPEHIYFELASGTSMKEAQKIATYLNENIKGVSLLTFKKPEGSGSDHRRMN
jgi:hypothetical protein